MPLWAIASAEVGGLALDLGEAARRKRGDVGAVEEEREALRAAEAMAQTLAEAMSGIARRRADKPPTALLNALSRRSIESGGVFIALRVQALCVISATIKNL
mgnify:CR=1 FL=1